MRRFVSKIAGHLNVQAPPTASVDQGQEIVTANLSGQGLTDIAEIAPNLQRLILNDNNIRTIRTSTFSRLTNLLELHLNSNELVEIPEFPPDLTLVTSLQMSNNKIVSVGKSVRSLKRLKALYLSRNPIASVVGAEEMSKMKHLKTLHLGSCNLSAEMLTPFLSMSSLTELNVSFNQIRTLPADIGNLEHLKTLDISSNLLVTFPVDFFRLTRLHSLSASHNRFSSLKPIDLSKADSKEEISPEVDEELCQSVLKLSALFRADFTDNLIEEVPVEWFALRHFKEFRLARNKLQQIRIRTIPRLEIIDVAQNQLQFLPLELSEAAHLVTLHTEDNPLELPPPVVQRKGTAAVLNYLKGFSFFAASDPSSLARGTITFSWNFAEFVDDQSDFADCLLLPSQKDAVPIRSHLILLECSGIDVEKLEKTATEPLVTFVLRELRSALAIRKLVEFLYLNEIHDLSLLPLDLVSELIAFAERHSLVSLSHYLTNFVMSHIMSTATNLPPNIRKIQTLSSYKSQKAFEPLPVEFLLPRNLFRFHNSNKFSDMRFIVEGTPYPAHRVIVSERSSVFKQTLTGPFREAKERQITLSDLSQSAFKVVLEFLYARPVEEIAFDPESVSEVVLFSDQHDLHDLNVLAQKYMCENVSDENVEEMFQFATHCNAFHLRARCIQFIAMQRGQTYIESLSEETQEEIKAFRKHLHVLGEKDVFRRK